MTPPKFLIPGFIYPLVLYCAVSLTFILEYKLKADKRVLPDDDFSITRSSVQNKITTKSIRLVAK